MSSTAPTLYTPEEYLALERDAQHKSEYLNGRILARAGANLAHSTITANLVCVIGNQFVGRSCDVLSSDMRVKVAATGLFAYPDVVAVCGELSFDDEQRETLTNPSVVIEVLSPSTEAYDRGLKFMHYRRLESLTDYLLVAQDSIRIEHYTRHDAVWLLTEISGGDARLHLTSIGCDLPLRDIYDKVEFPPGSDPSRPSLHGWSGT